MPTRRTLAELALVGAVEGSVGWAAGTFIQATVTDERIRNLAVPAVWLLVIFLGGIYLIVRLVGPQGGSRVGAQPAQPDNGSAAIAELRRREEDAARAAELAAY